MHTKVEQLDQQIRALSEPRGDGRGSIALMHGRARFEDAHTVVVESEEPNRTRHVSANDFVIATGSRPRLPTTWPWTESAS